MGNSTTLTNDIAAARKSLQLASNSLISNIASLASSANEFVTLVNKIEERFKELEKKESELQKREEQVAKKNSEFEHRKVKLDDKEKALNEREKGLNDREKRITEQEKEWRETQKRVEANASKLKAIVQMNVGGQHFEVPKATLLQFEGSYFHSMISSEHSQIFNSEYFIDLNPKNFHKFLDYMRTKRVSRTFIKHHEEIRALFSFLSIPFPDLSLSLLPEAIHQWLPKREFSLVYKATRDGFHKDDFHRTCDNKGATLTLIQSEKGYLFGGFSPLSFGSNSAGRDTLHPDFFLFTLSNPHNIPPTQYFLKEKSDASHYAKGLHVSFGAADLRISESEANVQANSYSYFPYSYVDTTGKGNVTLAGEEKFKVKEIEVYIVI